jgi:hypothetical protein
VVRKPKIQKVKEKKKTMIIKVDTELTSQRFFHMFGEDYIFRTTHIFLWIK